MRFVDWSLQVWVHLHCLLAKYWDNSVSLARKSKILSLRISSTPVWTSKKLDISQYRRSINSNITQYMYISSTTRFRSQNTGYGYYTVATVGKFVVKTPRGATSCYFYFVQTPVWYISVNSISISRSATTRPREAKTCTHTHKKTKQGEKNETSRPGAAKARVSIYRRTAVPLQPRKKRVLTELWLMTTRTRERNAVS